MTRIRYNIFQRQHRMQVFLQLFYVQVLDICLKKFPSKLIVSPLEIILKQVTYSFMRFKGYSNLVPCQFSASIGVLAPIPIIVRFFEILSRVEAAIAVMAGDLENILTMDVPSL